MAKPRLTPKQLKTLRSVAVAEGKVFPMSFYYHFLSEKGLTRSATREEIQTHYQGLADELEGLRYRLQALVALARNDRDWMEVSRVASHGDCLCRQIRNRQDDEKDGLVVLTEAALELVADRLSEKTEVNNG